MALIYIPEDGYDTTLSDGINKTQATIPVDALPAFETSGVLAIFETDNVTLRELIFFSATSTGPNELTTVTRRLPFGATAGVYTVAATGTAKDHPAGARIAMVSSSWYVGRLMSMMNDKEALPAVPKLPSSRVISDSRHLVDLELLNATAGAAGGINAFLVSEDSGLNVNVGAGRWMLNGVTQTYAGAATQATTDNTTNFVQLKFDNTTVINTIGFLEDHLPLGEVVTSGGAITGITDRRGWLSLPFVERSKDFTYGATISALDPLYVDSAASDKLKKALASGSSTADVVAIAIDAGVDTDTDKRVYLPGTIITGLSGLTSNAPVFLTDAGGFSATPGTYRKAVGHALSTTSMFFMPIPSIEKIAGLNADVTTAIMNEMADFFGATDMTGAEAETLTDTSDASALHNHDDAVRQIPRTVFRPDENTPFNSSGGGSSQLQEMTYSITTDGSGNSQTIDIVDSGIGSFDKDHVIDVFVKIVGTNNNAFIGIGAVVVPTDHLSTTRHAGFFIDDAAIHASQADGSTQDVSADLSITVTDWNHLRIEYTAGGSTLFYLNGTLVSTLSSNQPSGSTSYKSYRIGVEGDNADVIHGTYPLIEIEP